MVRPTGAYIYPQKSVARSRLLARGLLYSILLILLLFFGFAQGAEDQDCYACHSDPTLVVERNGRPFSLFVKEGTLTGTVHESNGCVSCHPDADVQEFPHGSPLQKVDCGTCHEDQAAQYANSLHGQALARGDRDAPACVDCHGKHVILGAKNPKSPTYVMNIPALCGQCHREDSEVARRHKIAEKDVISNYTESIHGEGLFIRGLIVTAVCTNCHTSHNVLPHTDAQSSINRNNIAKTCMQCHAQIESVHQRVIRGELWEKQPHAIPACVDCHSPHRIRRVFYEERYTNDYCLGCHLDRKLVRTRPDGSLDSLYVDPSAIEHSAHNQNIACVKCHTNVSQRQQPVCKDSGPVDCSICHAEETTNYAQGIHGKLLKQNDPNAPFCTDCHGTHHILPKADIASATFPRNIPQLCAKCHREGEKAAVRYKGTETQVVAHYVESIHGKGLFESGLMVSATCSDCHLSHKILPASDPNSSVNTTHAGTTCATCHLGIYEDFKKSIHSPTVAAAARQKLPACNSCHKSHEIARVDRDDFRNEILTQCGGCHEDVTNTYFETYHGKFSKLGYAKAAKCYDCHGSHKILPPTHTASTLSRQNIVETCKKCHPNSNRKFTGYLTHATHHNRFKYPILYYTFWTMTLLIIGVFTFFGLHTLLWIPRSIRERVKLKERLKGQPREYMVRFGRFPRILHIMVIVSFFGLALTGMSIKFSGFGWALAINHFFGGVEAAGLIHRLCALVTFLYFGLHFSLIYQTAKKEKIRLWKFITSPEGLMPNKRDLKEYFQTILWFLGKREAPQYGRWTYWEKFDYLAVFWGVAIIGSTGLILWFSTFFTRFLPGYLINVATIIHSDEALLATGFIFTVHFFNTHFRPQKFPMDQVIFTGKVPFEEWKHERPREYALLQESGKLHEYLVKNPPSRRLFLTSRIFGFFFLFLGFALVGLIIWAMLFQYR